MELTRNAIVKKINLFSIEKNNNELINLLCDILESENYMDNYDLILIIINIAELYGYQEFFYHLNVYSMPKYDVHSISNKIRKDLYKSKKTNNKYYTFPLI